VRGQLVERPALMLGHTRGPNPLGLRIDLRLVGPWAVAEGVLGGRHRAHLGVRAALDLVLERHRLQLQQHRKQGHVLHVAHDLWELYRVRAELGCGLPVPGERGSSSAAQQRFQLDCGRHDHSLTLHVLRTRRSLARMTPH